MKYTQPTDEQLALWKKWPEGRPEIVRKLAERFDPWTLYRMKSTGQRVTLAAISEDGTVRVNVSGEFNLVSHERSVFGIDPDDLEECDLPTDDELLGTVDLSVEEVRELSKLDEATRKLKLLAIAVVRPLRTYPRDWSTKK